VVKPKEKIESLLDVISELFDEGTLSLDLPSGVEKVERVTSEAVRVKFVDKVDYDLLYMVAAKEGYSVEAGSFALRVMNKGTIVARVGSQSDPGGEHNMFIYLHPPLVEQMSTYRKAIAVRDGVLNQETGKMNLERFYKYNLKVIRLVEKYRKSKYQSLTRRLQL